MKKVCVFGLGFVGLPLALSFAMRGCSVYGVDIDEQLVDNLNKGITHHLESYNGTPIQEILRSQLQAGRFQAAVDCTEALAECDNIIVTVGIPVEEGSHDLSHVVDVSRSMPRD